MNNHQPMDPFTYHVMEQIDPKGACLTYPILSGRDRCLHTRRIEEERRWLISLSGGLTLFILGVAPLVLFLMLLLYLIKCTFGINIMPDIHLKDLLTFWQ